MGHGAWGIGESRGAGLFISKPVVQKFPVKPAGGAGLHVPFLCRKVFG